MSVHQYRLERGWSQEDLATHSGLSVRTIQRIESGKAASLESLKCLAAAFDTTITDLTKEAEMPSTGNTDNYTLPGREKAALEYVENLKGFYVHLIVFAIIIPGLVALNYFVTPDANWVIYVIIPWLAAIVLQALVTFSLFNFLGPKWEQEQFRKRMED